MNTTFIKTLLLMSFGIAIQLFSKAQTHKCGTASKQKRFLYDHPEAISRRLQNEKEISRWISANHKENKSGSRSIITIPTVVHVIWHDPIENISDDQIISQLEVLNKDFRLLNEDSLTIDHPFWEYTGDAEIEFCLAIQDPDGNETTGITRTETSTIEWTSINKGNIKFSANGGMDNWDPDYYLNIWVANLEDNLFGFASFPDELESNPERDGVVINYDAFGNIGTAGLSHPELNGGRTATHEIGHWLNLYHVWGDTICGDDLVEDTEVAETENSDCPLFPYNANSNCGSGVNGEMFMNYMDYVDDDCMNMFTIGQTQRMSAAISLLRPDLSFSTGCELPNSTNFEGYADKIEIYPNPTNINKRLTITNRHSNSNHYTIVNLFGETIKDFGIMVGSSVILNIDEISSGSYFLRSVNFRGTSVNKIVITE